MQCASSQTVLRASNTAASPSTQIMQIPLVTWHALHARRRSWRLQRRAEAQRQATLLQVSCHPGVKHRLQGLPLHRLVGPGLLAQGPRAGQGGNAGRRGAVGCSRRTLKV